MEAYPISYSLVTSMEGIRLILGLAARNNWRLSTFDVKNAYLDADLDEELYMEAPFGMDLDDDEVLALLKALYGIKQAGRCWFRHLVKILK